MKSILILITGLLITFYCKPKQTCNIFPNNTKPFDTVVVSATLLDFMMYPPNDYSMKYLIKKKYLKLKEVKASVRFVPENCDRVYNIPLGDDSKTAIKILTGGLGQKIEVTCVIFRDKGLPKIYHPPLVVITKVRKAE